MISSARGDDFLETILDSWDRNNRILINLLRALPAGGLAARAMAGSPTVAEMFTHIHYVRLVFLEEDFPEFGAVAPAREWFQETDADMIGAELERSGKAVRAAMALCLARRLEMKLHYDHPLLYLQHMIWHEGYHHGQIKLALKMAGLGFEDTEIGPLTWRVWMNKTRRGDGVFSSP